MITKTTPKGWMLSLLSALFLLAAFTACSSSSDETDGGGDFIQVPGNEGDTWVKDGDIQDADLNLLVELSAKAERLRQEYVLMLSNNGMGDKIFCGAGLNSDVGPTLRIMTEILERQDEYREALDRLTDTNLMKPTGTRGLKDIWNIFTSGKAEAEKEKEIVQEVLTANNVYNNAEAQKQLYDFYCSQEPERAKKIGAADASDFFKKLNNGDLNNYMLNISHIWRDKGIEKADQTGNAVGDYALTAFTGKAEYVNSAYRVGGKVAVAAGKLYFTAIDDMVGGYGSKIMDFGDAIQNQITRLKLMKKTLEGKPDWQGWNTYLVNNLKDDLKSAITGAIGDDDSFGKDLVEMVSEEILGWMAEQCTSNDNGDGTEEAKQKKDEAAKSDDIAIINIETDFGSQGKMVIITDETTGQFHVGTLNADGRMTVSTEPGNKLITIIKNNGERLTKQITAVAGSNSVSFKSEQVPYIETNPRSITIDSDGSKELAYVLTNCKYVKYRQTSGSDWCKVDMKIYYGKSGQLTPENSVQFTAEADANNEGKQRNATIVLEGYNDNSSGAKPVATYSLKVLQNVNGVIGDASVSPSELTFAAEGGTQEVKITTKDFKKFGHNKISEEYASWLSAESVKGGIIKITTQPNTTGEARTGEVIVYVTNEEKPTNDQKVLLPVKVKQEAGGYSRNLILKNINYLSIYVTANWKNENGDIESESVQFLSKSANYNPPVITFNQNGSTVHVESSLNWILAKDINLQDDVSFDLVNFEGDLKDCKIQNLKIKSKQSRISYYWQKEGEIVLNISKTIKRDASGWRNLSAVKDKKDSADWYEMVSATCKYSYLNAQENYITQNYTYISDGQEDISFEIDMSVVENIYLAR